MLASKLASTGVGGIPSSFSSIGFFALNQILLSKFVESGFQYSSRFDAENYLRGLPPAPVRWRVLDPVPRRGPVSDRFRWYVFRSSLEYTRIVFVVAHEKERNTTAVAIADSSRWLVGRESEIVQTHRDFLCCLGCWEFSSCTIALAQRFKLRTPPQVFRACSISARIKPVEYLPHQPEHDTLISESSGSRKLLTYFRLLSNPFASEDECDCFSCNTPVEPSTNTVAPASSFW